MWKLLNWFALYNWRWRSQLMWRVFFTSAVVAVVVRTAMGWCKSGSCGHFGSGGFIIWDLSGLGSKLTSAILCSSLPWAIALFLTDPIFSGQEDYSFEELLPMAIIGVIGGLLGKFYTYGLRLIFFFFSLNFWFNFLSSLQEHCSINLLFIYHLGAEIIYTRKVTKSR